MHGTGIHWVVPGSIEQVTGGYRYDRLIVEGLRRTGNPVTVHELPGPYPFVDEDAIRAADSILGRLPDGAAVVVDALAFPGVAGSLWLDGRRLRFLGLVHHPLSLETGLTQAQADALRHLERGCLARMARVVVTSGYTAEVLAAFGVAGDRVGVVEPGVDKPPHPARGSGGDVPHLLCVATLTPRKGHLVLVEALARVADLPWRLTCVGGDARDPACTEEVREAVARHGLGERTRIAGETRPDAMGPVYDGADLFVMASHYEGYGMAFAEALAWGLPVVGTRAGAIPSVVPEGAGVLVPPGDAGALAAALREVLSDPARQAGLRAGALAVARGLPGWDRQAGRFLGEVQRLA